MRRRTVVALSLALGFTSFLVAAGTSAMTLGAPSSEDSMGQQLTAAQQRQITSIAEGDVTVQALVGSYPHTISGVSPWIDNGGSLLGGIVTYTFAMPVQSLSGTWIGLDYDCSETSLQLAGRRTYSKTYGNVTSIAVYVELAFPRVDGTVAVSAVDASALTRPQGRVSSSGDSTGTFNDDSCVD